MIYGARTLGTMNLNITGKCYKVGIMAIANGEDYGLRLKYRYSSEQSSTLFTHDITGNWDTVGPII